MPARAAIWSSGSLGQVREQGRELSKDTIDVLRSAWETPESA